MTVAIPVREIAQAVGGHLQGDDSLVIEGAAGLDEAAEKEISFFHNPKYVGQLSTTKAGAVIVPEKLNGHIHIAAKTVIRVANPQLAFAHVLAILDQHRVHHPEGIHPRAIIDPSARLAPGVAVGANTVIERDVQIGSGTVIYAASYVGENCRIGENCLIYPQVVLREHTEVGNRVILHSGVVLGADGYGFATHEGRHHKIPQIGRVVVEDDVEIGANVTVDRATTGATRIGAGTKIDNLVQIAHNVQIGRDCLIVAQAGIAGSTRLGDHVTLAAQAGLVGHLKIGDGAVIAAQSGVMNDVAPGEVLFGSPARPHKQAMKLQAIFGKLPEIYDTLRALKKKILT
jgi:UDP-3-O-[3-hydroxymyristoyl] glucosamine N-acyltransferase